MSDLISRSALDVDLQNLVREYNRNCESDKSAGAFKALYHLRLAPAVDAVEVVRCKECKHWDVDPDTYGNAFGPEGCCFGIADGSTLTKHDDFCSWGERRADDGK